MTDDHIDPALEREIRELLVAGKESISTDIVQVTRMKREARDI